MNSMVYLISRVYRVSKVLYQKNSHIAVDANNFRTSLAVRIFLICFYHNCCKSPI